MRFIKLFRTFIAHFESTSVHFEKRKPKTIEAYYTRYASVVSYLDSRNLLKLDSSKFTLRLAHEYFQHCAEKHSNNYAARNVDICREVLKFGVAKMLIKANPLRDLELKKTGPNKPLFLDPIELIALRNYQPAESMLAKARDMFLFQSSTGFDYTDTCTITEDHIITYKDRQFFKKPRNKTGVIAFVPIEPEAANLLEKHNGSMRLLSNAKYNQALKTISTRLNLSVQLTSHMGRKSYAMNKLNSEGYSIESVSKMIGHRMIKTTEMYYAQVEIDLIVREMERLDGYKERA